MNSVEIYLLAVIHKHVKEKDSKTSKKRKLMR
jgi:hypothetical protein